MRVALEEQVAAEMIVYFAKPRCGERAVPSWMLAWLSPRLTCWKTSGWVAIRQTLCITGDPQQKMVPSLQTVLRVVVSLSATCMARMYISAT